MKFWEKPEIELADVGILEFNPNGGTYPDGSYTDYNSGSTDEVYGQSTVAPYDPDP